MTQKQQIQLFEAKKVRTVWDDELEEWFFSVVDVVDVLTDSKDPTDYLKKMRKRDPQLKAYMGTNCPQITMLTKTGKPRKTVAANTEQLFRIIQAIPSAKAEPFKEWMAQVAAQRIDQMQDPELNFEQAYADYRRLGYSDKWINQRIRSIEVRKELTDEWDRAGVTEGQQYASLTDIITRGWSGKTTKQYKQFKGLHKGGLNRPARNSGHGAHGIRDNPLPGGHTEKGWIPHRVRRFFFALKRFIMSHRLHGLHSFLFASRAAGAR